MRPREPSTISFGASTERPPLSEPLFVGHLLPRADGHSRVTTQLGRTLRQCASEALSRPNTHTANGVGHPFGWPSARVQTQLQCDPKLIHVFSGMLLDMLATDNATHSGTCARDSTHVHLCSKSPVVLTSRHPAAVSTPPLLSSRTRSERRDDNDHRPAHPGIRATPAGRRTGRPTVKGEGGGRVRLPQSVLLVLPRFPCPRVGDVDDIVVRGVGVYDGTSLVTGGVAPRPERAATPDRTYLHRLLLRSMSAAWANSEAA